MADPSNGLFPLARRRGCPDGIAGEADRDRVVVLRDRVLDVHDLVAFFTSGVSLVFVLAGAGQVRVELNRPVQVADPLEGEFGSVAGGRSFEGEPTVFGLFTVKVRLPFWGLNSDIESHLATGREWVVARIRDLVPGRRRVGSVDGGRGYSVTCVSG